MFVVWKLSLLLFASGVRGVNKEFVYLKSMSQSSASFPDCILQTYMVRSKLDCVRRCFSLTSCTRLTYTTLARDSGSCVCLSSCVTNNNIITTSETVYLKLCGGNVYNTTLGATWLNKTCVTNVDCPVENSECYSQSSTCLCTPGYYYSIRCNTCVRECDPRNLRNTFVKYAGGYLSGHDDSVHSGVTSQRCEMLCAADRHCLSFDYLYAQLTCYMSYDTALTSNAFRFTAINSQDYYQRMCF